MIIQLNKIIKIVTFLLLLLVQRVINTTDCSSSLTELECESIKAFKENVPDWLIPSYELVGTPTIIQKFKNETLTSTGTNVTFTCSTGADRQAVITFFYLNSTNKINASLFKPLKILDAINEHYQVEQVFSKDDININDQHAEQLTVLNVTQQDSGLYLCIIGNYYGIRITSGYLSVVNELPSQLLPGNSIIYHLILIIIGCLTILLVLIFLVILKFCRKKPESFEKSLETMKVNLLYPYINKTQMNENEIYPHSKDNEVLIDGNDCSSLLSSARSLLDDKQYYIPIDQLSIGKKIGEGAFGVVFSGCMNKDKPVAIKTLKENANYQELKNLIQELEIMKIVGTHKNIVTLLGISQNNDGSILAIVEYAKHGNLRDFLRTKRLKKIFSFNSYHQTTKADLEKLTFKDLVRFSHSIALGMDYLHSKNILHRDLAARNILVCENFEIKVADFGLARDIEQNYYYKRQTDGRLPVKWMAIECLFDRKVYSNSDLWSFGVLLWEIFSLGGTPYPSVPVEKLYDYLKQGNRMTKPMYSNSHIYEWMLKCWNIKPSKRPSFKESIEFFEQELKKCSSLDSLTKSNTKLSLDSILIDTNTYEDLNITTTSNHTNNSCSSDDNLQLSILNNENIINNIKMIDENLNDSNYESASSSYYSSSSVNNNDSIYNDNMKLLIDKTRKNSFKFIDTIKMSNNTNNNGKLPILLSVDENFV